MGWFNVLKGAYPTLQQIDKTLVLKAGETDVVRGTLIYEDTNGQWVKATASDDADPAKHIHFALMPQDDLTAGMAGSVGQGAYGPNTGGLPRITGLSCSMPMEFETDQYDTGQTYAIGDLLKPANGGVVTLHSTGKNCVGQVTKLVASRWVNNAVAVTGYRTGANVNVLTARSLWVPKLTV
jgi:hypothetical protein